MESFKLLHGCEFHGPFGRRWWQIFDRKIYTEIVFRHGSTCAGANASGCQIGGRMKCTGTFSDLNDASWCDRGARIVVDRRFHIDHIYGAERWNIVGDWTILNSKKCMIEMFYLKMQVVSIHVCIQNALGMVTSATEMTNLEKETIQVFNRILVKKNSEQ